MVEVDRVFGDNECKEKIQHPSPKLYPGSTLVSRQGPVFEQLRQLPLESE